MSKWGLVFETPEDIEIREQDEREYQEYLSANYGDGEEWPTEEEMREFFDTYSEEMYSDPMEWEM